MFLIKGTLIAQLPDFTQTDCDGVTHHLYGDLSAGKAVIINFCAGWCGPCRLYDPMLETVYKDFDLGKCNLNVYAFIFETNIPGEITDCAFAKQYAQTAGMTFPVFANVGSFFSGLVGDYFAKYNLEGIPAFLIILPNAADPANSEVKIIVGGAEDLAGNMEDSLALGGFNRHKINVSGEFCTDQPFSATLTSDFPSGNILWSTNETTPSIIVDHTGTYSVTDNSGCSTHKYVEFNHPPVMGTASISSANVCENGVFTVNYAVPPGDETNAIWQIAVSPDYEWTDLGVPANAGPLTLVAWDPAGTTYKFRVKGTNGSGIEGNNCVNYSNETEITINNSTPTSIPGTASISAAEACRDVEYTLSYSGGIENSLWEYYEDASGLWFSFAPANDQPLSVTAIYVGTTVNGRPGDRFRVKSPVGDCYALSNEVEIGYLPSPTPPSISGPPSICEGSGGITLEGKRKLPGLFVESRWTDHCFNNSQSINIHPLFCVSKE